MLKHIMLLLALAATAPALAQNKADSTAHADNEVEIKIGMRDFERLKSERDSAMTAYKALLPKYNKIVKNDSALAAQLQTARTECATFKLKCDELQQAQRKANVCLFNIASNFLYIPYEAYSVEKLAIPAFEAVTDEELKTQHSVNYELLKSYQNDVKQLLDFITSAEKELGNPFAKNADEQLRELHNLPAYINYKQYRDWKGTWLGKRLCKVEAALRNFKGDCSQLKFGTIKKELQDCLDTTNDL